MLQPERHEIKRPGETEAVIFLVHKGGRFLVEERTKEGSGYWGHVRIPGGNIEKGETPEDAMKREVKEELDIEVKSFIYLDTFEDVTLNGDYYVFHAFLVLDYEGEVRNQEPERNNIFWLPIPEAWDSLKLASSRYVLCLSEKALT